MPMRRLYDISSSDASSSKDLGVVCIEPWRYCDQTEATGIK